MAICQLSYSCRTSLLYFPIKMSSSKYDITYKLTITIWPRTHNSGLSLRTLLQTIFLLSKFRSILGILKPFACTLRPYVFITAEKHSSTIFALDNKPVVIIQNNPVSNPYEKDMFISTIFVEKYAQSFETTRISNSTVTTPRVHILLGYDDAQLFETNRIDNHNFTAPSERICFGRQRCTVI